MLRSAPCETAVLSNISRWIKVSKQYAYYMAPLLIGQPFKAFCR